MNNSRILIKLFLLLIVLFLVSCKGSTERVWSVENESSTLIKVRASLRINSDTVWENIPKGESKIITITTEDWGNSEFQLAYDVFKSFLVTRLGGDTSNIDWADNDSWEIFIEQTKHKPDHYQQSYDLVVTDADFE